MNENRFSNQAHENNGQDNGELHHTLPGPGTLPEELLGGSENAASAGFDADSCLSAGNATQSVRDRRSHGDRGN